MDRIAQRCITASLFLHRHFMRFLFDFPLLRLMVDGWCSFSRIFICFHHHCSVAVASATFTLLPYTYVLVARYLLVARKTNMYRAEHILCQHHFIFHCRKPLNIVQSIPTERREKSISAVMKLHHDFFRRSAHKMLYEHIIIYMKYKYYYKILRLRFYTRKKWEH